MYRAPSESAAAAEAYRQARVAYEALVARQPRVTQANQELLARGERLLNASEYIAPEPPPAEQPGKSLAHYIRQLEGVTTYYLEEATRLDAQLARADAARAEVDTPTFLGFPPRKVPFTYVVSEFYRGFWLCFRFLLFPPFTMLAGMLVVPLDYVHPALALLPLLGVTIYALVRFVRRVHYLRRGEVPIIVARTIRSTNVRNANVPRLVARGWRVTLEWFSGRSVETELTYRTSQGTTGRARVYGPEFHGVLLCLPGRPNAALPNTAFACTPTPNDDWGWNGRGVPARVWVTNVFGAAMATAYGIVVVERILATF